MAMVTPSSSACVAPCADVGRKGWAESPRRRILASGLTQVGRGSRYTSFQSTSLSSGVLDMMRVHMGSQSLTASSASETLPGKLHDSSMSCSSGCVRTQQQSAPFLMVLKRKCISGPIQPLNVSPLTQKGAGAGAAAGAGGGGRGPGGGGGGE